MVGPQKAKPAALRSFDSFRESSVSAGTWARLVSRLWTGRPSTNRHRKREKPSRSSTASHARALATAPSILARFRTMPGSRIRASIRAAAKRATAAGSKPREGAAEVLALAQDGDPGQPGL